MPEYSFGGGGHRGDGPLLEANKSSHVNKRNFRELLHFQMKSDDIKLQNHLKTLQSWAMYINKTTQNELIECCGEEIFNGIMKNIKAGGVYRSYLMKQLI